MNPQSAKALAWTAGILTVLAPAIISPSGSFPLLVLAAICAAVPSAFASKRTRLISIILLIASIVLAASFYPDFVSEQSAYRQHAQERTAKPQVTMPADQGAKKK